MSRDLGLRFYGEGTVTANPELKSVGNNGTALATVRVAFNRAYRQGDKWEREAAFVPVQAWAKLAEQFAGAVQKGTQVFVEGYVVQRSWEDKASGKQHSMLVLNLVDFHVVVRVKRGNGNGNQPDNDGGQDTGGDDAPPVNTRRSQPQAQAQPRNQRQAAPSEPEMPDDPPYGDSDIPF